MRFVAIQVEIDAVQFTGPTFEAPEWLVPFIEAGKISKTINAKDQYLTIFGKNSKKRAYPGDWVCKNMAGGVFVLSDNEMLETFERK